MNYRIVSEGRGFAVERESDGHRVLGQVDIDTARDFVREMENEFEERIRPHGAAASDGQRLIGLDNAARKCGSAEDIGRRRLTLCYERDPAPGASVGGPRD